MHGFRYGWLLAACLTIAFASSTTPAASAIVSEMRNVNAVAEVQGFRINPAYNAAMEKPADDLAPVQAFEIFRPEGKAFTIGRLYTSCTCIRLESPKRTFEQGERAVLQLRNISPTPTNGQVYAIYVQITSPVRATLRFDTFVQSKMVPDTAGTSAGAGAPATPPAPAPSVQGVTNPPDSPRIEVIELTKATDPVELAAKAAQAKEEEREKEANEDTAAEEKKEDETAVADNTADEESADEEAEEQDVSGVQLPLPPAPGEETIGEKMDDAVSVMDEALTEYFAGDDKKADTTASATPAAEPARNKAETTLDSLESSFDNAWKDAEQAVADAGDTIAKAEKEVREEAKSLFQAPPAPAEPIRPSQRPSLQPPSAPVAQTPVVPSPTRAPQTPARQMGLQTISLVTVGVSDLSRSIRFYEALGWRRAAPNKYDQTAFFQLNGQILALYPMAELLKEQNMEDARPAPGSVTLALHVLNRGDVEVVYDKFMAAGGTSLKPPTEMPSGAVTGYVADPDGNPWEISWVPQFKVDADGGLWLP